MHIRPTEPADVPRLVAIAEATRVFKPLEIAALREVFDDYFANTVHDGHRAFTLLDGEAIVAFSYHAPVEMTEDTWQLWWIAVDPAQHSRGVGKSLLAEVETDVRRLGGRVLFIETSSLPHYEPTRRFYVRQGYDTEAVMRDWYAQGDDMVVFRKSFMSK